jgi:hypothetical protein
VLNLQNSVHENFPIGAREDVQKEIKSLKQKKV